MNGKKARKIRKALSIKKPTPFEEVGGLYKEIDRNGEPYLMFRRASNPQTNFYRYMKRKSQ